VRLGCPLSAGSGHSGKPVRPVRGSLAEIGRILIRHTRDTGRIAVVATILVGVSTRAPIIPPVKLPMRHHRNAQEPPVLALRPVLEGGQYA